MARDQGPRCNCTNCQTHAWIDEVRKSMTERITHEPPRDVPLFSDDIAQKLQPVPFESTPIGRMVDAAFGPLTVDMIREAMQHTWCATEGCRCLEAVGAPPASSAEFAAYRRRDEEFDERREQGS